MRCSSWLLIAIAAHALSAAYAALDDRDWCAPLPARAAARAPPPQASTRACPPGISLRTRTRTTVLPMQTPPLPKRPSRRCARVAVCISVPTSMQRAPPPGFRLPLPCTRACMRHAGRRERADVAGDHPVPARHGLLSCPPPPAQPAGIRARAVLTVRPVQKLARLRLATTSQKWCVPLARTPRTSTHLCCAQHTAHTTFTHPQFTVLSPPSVRLHLLLGRRQRWLAEPTQTKSTLRAGTPSCESTFQTLCRPFRNPSELTQFSRAAVHVSARPPYTAAKSGSGSGLRTRSTARLAPKPPVRHSP